MTGAAHATPRVPAAWLTQRSGSEPVASMLSVAAEATQTSTSFRSAKLVTRPWIPVSSDICCIIRKTETTTPARVARLLAGSSTSIRAATPTMVLLSPLA